MTTYTETERHHRPRPSLAGAFGGICAAFGALLLLAAAVAAIVAAIGPDGSFGEDGWRAAGIGGTAGAGVALLAAFVLGGYVAGRMARRAGAGNGLAVFALGAFVFGASALIVNVFVDIELGTAAEDAGIPTFGDPWTTLGIAAAAGLGLAMLAGSIMGGMMGARAPEPVTLERRTAVRQGGQPEGGEAEEREAEAQPVDLRDVGERRETEGEGEVRSHADGSMTTR